MIQRNKQLNAADDLERARRMLDSATLLLDHGHHEDAASNAYYAAHHAARALLFSLGLEVRSHDALRALLARHFERPGLLPRGTVKKLGDAFEARMKATYGVGVHFSRDQAAASVAWARAFLPNAADILGDFLATLASKGPSTAREGRPPYRKRKSSGRAGASKSSGRGATRTLRPTTKSPRR